MTKTLNLTHFLFGTSLIIMAFFLMSSPVSTSAETINRQLELGMSGSDISAMQSYFAEDPTIYPQGLVTGYFGFLTKSAVANFQSANGLPSVGRVGPATLPILNAKMSSGNSGGTSGSAPSISNVTINASSDRAVISWITNENARGLVYYDNKPLVTYEHLNSADVSGATVRVDNNYHVYQNIPLTNLQSNTTYYYLIYTTDQQGNVSVTWPTSFRTTN